MGLTLHVNSVDIVCIIHKTRFRASMGSPDQQQPWRWHGHIGDVDNPDRHIITRVNVSKEEFVREVNLVNSIAWPMIVVLVSQFMLRLMPMFMLGNLGELTFSAASLAFTFCNITGYSVLLGMASALETLCGQAYGAGQYKQVGTFTNAAIISLFLTCLPISILWIFTNKLFLFLGQDPLISKEAGIFAFYLIPSLFPYAILKSQTRYLQTQNLILPMLWTSLASMLVDLLLCWASIFKLNLGSIGAALSVGFSYWFNAALLAVYAKYSPACEKTYASFSMEDFFCLREFFQYALPSAMMVCLEWWCFEIIIFLSGILPNPQIEVNVLSICMSVTSLHYSVAYSFAVAASTRISNELGAGNPQAARVALFTVLILSVTEFVIAAVAVFIFRGAIGYAFIKEKEVVIYIQEMAPLLSLSIFLDSLQCLLSGVARGCGWQETAAYVNLGAYYMVGIPVALLMGFTRHLKGEGLWMGMVAGAAVQCILFSVVTCLIDWDKKAMEARQRIFKVTIPDQIELI